MSVCESFTWWHRPEPYFEKHPDEGMVERAGYMTTEQMVGELLRAGESLQVYREAEYSWDEDIPEDAPANRMRSDLDAILETRAVRARVDKALEDDKAAAAAKAEEEKAEKDKAKENGGS